MIELCSVVCDPVVMVTMLVAIATSFGTTT